MIAVAFVSSLPAVPHGLLALSFIAILICFAPQELRRSKTQTFVVAVLVAVALAGVAIYAEDLTQAVQCKGLTWEDYLYWAYGCWQF